MSQEITIILPGINPEVALAALREKYSPLARHNGHVKIGYSRRGDGSNWREEHEYYYAKCGLS
ncbi:MAG: hypothetical protein MN733_25890 [Nitrososphaera sp.]|nr:hypothetical protein [Nitrososphaera sp.]